MKILIVINALGYGGAEKQAIVDANSLCSRGYDITVAYYRSGELEKLLNKKVRKLKLPSPSSIISAIYLFSHLLFTKYDIVHNHMYWSSKAAGIVAKLTGHKVIYNEHGLGLWRKWYHILIIRLIALFADKIINSCDATRSIRHNRDKIRKHKLVTVYNSFNLEQNNNDSNKTINLTKSGNFIIGFVGSFNKVKRLDIFIEIAKELKKEIQEFKIIMVGDGAEKIKIEKLINKNNLGKYFILPGFITDTSPYYQNFDVFILPSIREAHSIALLEAGAHGLPSLAFDVGGNSEIIKNSYNGYVIPDGDIGSLVNRIIYLYKNPDLKIKMGNNSKKYINQHFSVEKRIKNLERVYFDAKL